MGKVLTISEQFELYLERISMSKAIMHPTQYTETRRAFFGGVGQMLNSASEDLGKLPEDEGIVELEKWSQECADFWDKELKENNDRGEDVSDG